MDLIDNKLLLFGGKGGTGKTSCAAATSIYSSSKGKKTLVMSTDPAHSLSDSFGKEIGNRVTKIKNNLYALEIDSESVLENYKGKYGNLIKKITEESTFFSKEDIQKFFDLSLPGMDELMALTKVIEILEENQYDIIILDTAPTGHTIRLLEMPELMSTYIKILSEMRQKHRVVVSMLARRYIKDKADEFIEKMHSDVESIKSVLKDPKKTKFIPITIPEAMSIYETTDLIKVLEGHNITIGKIIVNSIINENCDFCKAKKSEQEKYLRSIKKTFEKYEVLEVPLFPNEIKTESLEVLAKIIFKEEYKIPEAKIRIITEPKFKNLKLKPHIEFLLFGGKGGTGKTSYASAVALQESKNKKVLLFSTDPAHSLSDSLGINIGNSITRINKNLDALEINAYALFNNLKLKYKKEIQDFFKSIFKSSSSAHFDAPYDRKIMEDLFDLAPPGIDEIMALKTITDLMKDKKYSLFILDTAPTGQTIRLLELPGIVEMWIKVLLDIQEYYPLSLEINDTLNEILETIKKVKGILTDSKKSEFILVTIPESMALLETQDFVKALTKLKVPTHYLIINKITPKSKCNFCLAKRSEQIYYVSELKKLKLKTIGIRLFDKEIRGKDQLIKLSKNLYGTP